MAQPKASPALVGYFHCNVLLHDVSLRLHVCVFHPCRAGGAHAAGDCLGAQQGRRRAHVRGGLSRRGLPQRAEHLCADQRPQSGEVPRRVPPLQDVEQPGVRRGCLFRGRHHGLRLRAETGRGRNPGPAKPQARVPPARGARGGGAREQEPGLQNRSGRRAAQGDSLRQPGSAEAAQNQRREAGRGQWDDAGPDRGRRQDTDRARAAALPRGPPDGAAGGDGHGVVAQPRVLHPGRALSVRGLAQELARARPAHLGPTEARPTRVAERARSEKHSEGPGENDQGAGAEPTHASRRAAEGNLLHEPEARPRQDVADRGGPALRAAGESSVPARAGVGAQNDGAGRRAAKSWGPTGGYPLRDES
mmetsp:Transcript_20805/g.52434  ORF Transcript_20805/g.52434 Transcript_20805/m.52434 type:complete len:362 (+) Transcript_20805:185-1270(+)